MAQFVPFLSQQNSHVRIHSRQVTDLGEQPHYHDCYQILFVRQGRMLHQQVVLQPGDAFIVPPGYIHHTKAASEDLLYHSLTFRHSLFSPGFVTSPVSEFLDRLRLTEHAAKLRVCLPPREQTAMAQLMQLLEEECRTPYDAAFSMAGHLVAAVVRILARCHRQEDAPASDDPIDACIRYMDTNYMLPLTPDALARQFAVSRSALMEKFPAKAGMSVKRYLHHRRIGQAQKLLATGRLSVRETARLVGYEDFSTFYRNFKKLTGHSPTKTTPL